MERPKNVVRDESIDWVEMSHGERFGFRSKRLGATAGGFRLGCTLYELAPRMRAFPYHYHLANEEAIYVLEGVGTLRLGDEEVSVSRGDYIALPVGPEGAHQMSNTSSAPLRYLCLSTMIEPEVAVYPDSEKFGIFAGSAPGGSEEQRTLVAFLPRDAAVDYWEGE